MAGWMTRFAYSPVFSAARFSGATVKLISPSANRWMSRSLDSSTSTISMSSFNSSFSSRRLRR